MTESPKTIEVTSHRASNRQRPGRLLGGRVHVGADAAAAAARTSFNPAVQHRPDVVVEALDIGDVAAAVRWAADHHVQWAVLGTGHAETPAVAGGVLISTRGLSSVAVDPATRTARVGAGTRWREVMAAADQHGLAPVSGSAPDVGVIGLLMGGGVGPPARTLGTCSDRVRAVHLVVPGAGPRIVDADHDPDLFGALLGGRLNIGVVTAVDLELVPQQALQAGGLFYAAPDIADVVHAWTDWVDRGIPEDTTTSLAVLRLPDLPSLPPVLTGATVAHLRVATIGSAAGRDPLPSWVRGTATPVLGGVGPLPWNRIGEIHGDPVAPRVHVGGGLLLPDFTPDAARTLLQVAGPQVEPPLSIVEIRHLGGAAALAPDDRPDCVPGRDARLGMWVSSHPFPLDAAAGGAPPGSVERSAVRSVLDALDPWSSHAAAINFSGSANTPAEVPRGWTSAAHARIADVRRRFNL